MKIECESKNAFIALKRLMDKYEIHYADHQGIDEYGEKYFYAIEA